MFGGFRCIRNPGNWGNRLVISQAPQRSMCDSVFAAMSKQHCEPCKRNVWMQSAGEDPICSDGLSRLGGCIPFRRGEFIGGRRWEFLPGRESLGRRLMGDMRNTGRGRGRVRIQLLHGLLRMMERIVGFVCFVCNITFGLR